VAKNQFLRSIVQNKVFVLGGILILGLFLRIFTLAYRLQYINSDEAIIGLMARHILQGSFPIFYYGQQYYGPLDAYLTAPLFFLFGSSSATLHIIPLISSTLFIFVIEKLGTALYSPKVGLISAIFAALSSNFLTIRGLQADAAYSILLLIGTYSLLVFNQTIRHLSLGKITFLICICLLGVWVFPLMLYYISAMCLYWLLFSMQKAQKSGLSKPINLWKKVSLIIIFPMTLTVIIWFAGIFYGRSLLLQFGQTIANLFISVIPILLGFLPASGNYALFLQYLSLNPFWENSLIVLASVLIFFTGIGVGFRRSQKGISLLFLFVTLTLSLFLLFYVLMNVKPAVLSLPRYLFPLYSAIPLWVDGIIKVFKKQPRLQMVIFLFVIGSNLYGTLTFPKMQIDSRSLVEWFSSREGIQYVYTDYWTGYRLAFESQEKVIPFIIDQNNRSGVNRYKPYMKMVIRADHPIYLYESGLSKEKAFRDFLIEKQLLYQVHTIGAFTIYYDVSEPVYFLDAGLALAVDDGK